jgi:hypothetical protein
MKQCPTVDISPDVVSECEPKGFPKGYKIPVGKIKFEGELPRTDVPLAIAVGAGGLCFRLIGELVNAIAGLLNILDEVVLVAVLSVVANGDGNRHGFSV